MTDFDKQAGARIRDFREKLGFSRDKLSEMADIGSKFLYEIECGKKGMSAYTLHNIAKALNVSTDYILTGEGKIDASTRINSMLSKFSPEDIPHIENILREFSQIARK